MRIGGWPFLVNFNMRNNSLIHICMFQETSCTSLNGYMGRKQRVLMHNWMFITLLLQRCLKPPICSASCVEMRWRAQRSRCYFQVFGMRAAAIWPPTWSWLLYYQRGAPSSPGDLRTPRSLCDQCTHTHTHTHIYYATLLEWWTKPQGNQPLNASLMQT